MKPPSHETNKTKGWEIDWKPVADDELNQLIDREDPIQQIIDHNLQGMTTLYFIREKKGGICMVRSLIECQIQLGWIIKGLNFIGDTDNVVTEIVTPTKHREEIIADNDKIIRANEKSGKRRNILGKHLPQCNPYRRIWDKEKDMKPQQKESRTGNHVRRLVSQWHQCAQKARNEN